MTALTLLARLRANNEAVIEYIPDANNVGQQCWIVDRAGIVVHPHAVDRAFMPMRDALMQVASQVAREEQNLAGGRYLRIKIYL